MDLKDKAKWIIKNSCLCCYVADPKDSFKLANAYLKMREALEWYAKDCPWDDTVGNLSERARKALEDCK